MRRLSVVDEQVPNSIFDDENGLGAVPNNQSVDYLGFQYLMRPSQFLKLVPPRYQETAEEIEKKMKGGEKIGHPFLRVAWGPDKKGWKIENHEGRNRMMAIQAIYGDVYVPVHMFPAGWLRARHLKDDMFDGAEIIPQDKSVGKLSLPINKDRVIRGSA